MRLAMAATLSMEAARTLTVRRLTPIPRIAAMATRDTALVLTRTASRGYTSYGYRGGYSPYSPAYSPYGYGGILLGILVGDAS